VAQSYHNAVPVSSGFAIHFASAFDRDRPLLIQ
jgi:hypothetical protein